MRISKAILVICAAAALTACNTPANQTQAAATPGAKPDKPASAQLVCRSDPDTGTRIATRECHTEAEWAAIARQSEDTISTQGAMRPSGAPTSSLSGGAP
jgi:hypothetical protein